MRCFFLDKDVLGLKPEEIRAVWARRGLEVVVVLSVAGGSRALQVRGE